MKFPLCALLMLGLLFTAPMVSLTHGRLSAWPSPQAKTAAPIDTDRIVSAFTARETEFRNALAAYSFKRDARIQTIGGGGQVSGEYNRTSLLAPDNNGTRIEKILFFPTPTLSPIGISTEDLDNLGGMPFFALEASKASLYNLKYVGQERIDEIDLYVFDVAPKALPDPKKAKDRFFQGRVWVDTQDHQIVKTRGKSLPEPKNNPYPNVETYREEIDGHFWFPTYAYADEELILPSGQVMKMRLRIRLSEFKKATRN